MPKRSGSRRRRERTAHWRRWGPYLADRQWGTVREDYSPHGDAWDSFPHDHARSRVYRWGEDGILGISDNHQRLCFALALWNERDPILKERYFGLTGSEGNHGEDVKEYYFYLDSTPTHSYMRGLYKYPQAEFPYARLVEENRRRGRRDPEFELLDTGVFDESRYFDVVVEYAKADTGRHPDPDHGHQPRPRAGAAAPAADALVPEHVVWDVGAERPRLSREAGLGRGRDRRRASGDGGSLPAPLRGRARAAVHRERVECRTALGRRQSVAVREGRLSRAHRPRQRRRR